MSEQDRYIPGVPCWTDTNQPDPEAAVAFYSGLFGWECENAMPGDSAGRYYMARLRGGDVAAISSVPEGAPQMAMWNTYILVDSADAATSRITDAGGSVLMGPFDVQDAGRMAVVADTEGAMFRLWEARQHHGAAVVNEPGSVSFNDLHSRDREAAKRFYGAVFGWDVLELSDDAAMWTLAAYGDHLERLRPGLRDQMRDMGAPRGFENVVADVIRLGDERGDVPPHWGVTFGVDDADAIAERAEQLGGKVLVAPFDAPWVRVTVIADPQGATFTASKFVPENRDLGTPGERAAAGG